MGINLKSSNYSSAHLSPDQIHCQPFENDNELFEIFQVKFSDFSLISKNKFLFSLYLFTTIIQRLMIYFCVCSNSKIHFESSSNSSCLKFFFCEKQISLNTCPKMGNRRTSQSVSGSGLVRDEEGL